MLSATNRCNSRCRYCDIPGRQQTELTPQQMLRLVDEMADAGTRRLGIWGGEPLLRDDIGEIVSRARSYGLYVTLDTNGYLLEQRLPELEALDHVIVALDGPEQAHDANRGRGSFRKALRAIEVAKQRMKVWTITVLTKHNIGEIDFIVRAAQQYGFVPTFQILHHNETLGRGHGELVPSDHAYRAAFRKLRHIKRSGVRVGCSERYLSQMLSWQDYRVTTRECRHAGKRCQAGRLYCNIDTDGSLYGCSLLIGKVPTKNSADVGFQDAFMAIPPVPCQSCAAPCFTDYNNLFSLDLQSVLEWTRWMWTS